MLLTIKVIEKSGLSFVGNEIFSYSIKVDKVYKDFAEKLVKCINEGTSSKESLSDYSWDFPKNEETNDTTKQ